MEQIGSKEYKTGSKVEVPITQQGASNIEYSTRMKVADPSIK